MNLQWNYRCNAFEKRDSTERETKKKKIPSHWNIKSVCFLRRNILVKQHCYNNNSRSSSSNNKATKLQQSWLQFWDKQNAHNTTAYFAWFSIPNNVREAFDTSWSFCTINSNDVWCLAFYFSLSQCFLISLFFSFNVNRITYNLDLFPPRAKQELCMTRTYTSVEFLFCFLVRDEFSAERWDWLRRV